MAVKGFFQNHGVACALVGLGRIYVADRLWSGSHLGPLILPYEGYGGRRVLADRQDQLTAVGHESFVS